MKLSDYKNEDAVEVIADIIEPLSVIFTDEEIKNEKNRMKAIAKALKKYKKEVIQILARIDGVPVDEYECNALTLPIKVLEVMNDKEVQDFLESLGAMED
jgi:hypothetical protein